MHVLVHFVDSFHHSLVFTRHRCQV